MELTYEFRVNEKYASLLFGPDEGTRLGGFIRKVRVVVADPRFSEIGALQRRIRAERGEFFFAGWKILRTYSSDEINSAEIFSLEVTAVHNLAGSEYGTTYDYSSACPLCRAGRVLRGPLRLDLKGIPKNCDLARTLAGDEILVSNRLAESLQSAAITGYRLKPVEGVRSSDGGASTWFSLEPVSRPVRIGPPTKFGIEPFDEDLGGRYTCPLGHTLGLNLLSEVLVVREDWDGSDFLCTAENVGVERGLLVPSPILLVSARLKSLLEEGRFRRYETDVAYLQ